MVNGINLNTLSDLLAKISNKEDVTNLSQEEKHILKEAMGSNSSANNAVFESNYKDAMQKIGAENENERNQVLNQIKEMIEHIVSNAKDKSAAICAINNLLCSVAEASDAESALKELIKGLQIQCATVDTPKGKENTPEARLNNKIAKYISYEPISPEDYRELINLLGEASIPYTIENNGNCKNIKFTDKNGKTYSLATNQIPEDELINDYMETQINTKTFDSIEELEKFSQYQGIALTASEPKNGKVTISCVDNNGVEHNATVVVNEELPSYDLDAVSMIGIDPAQEPYTKYLAFNIETGEFSINRNNVEKDFSEWEKQNGPITTLEELQNAMQANAMEACHPNSPFEEEETGVTKQVLIENMIEDFIKGNTNSKTFNKQLDDLGIEKLTPANDSNNYNFTFTIDGVDYHIAGISKEKVRNNTENDIIGFMKKDLTNISSDDINKYFDIVAWQGDNKEDGAMGYVLKDEWAQKLGSSINGSMNISQIMDAIKNYKPTETTPEPTYSIDDDINNDINNEDKIKNAKDVIREFIKGNLNVNELSNALSKIGANVPSSNKGNNGIYEFIITVAGKEYKISGITVDAVKNGTANDNIAALADDLTAEGLTEKQIQEYFTPVAWEGDTVIGYVLKDEAKTKFGYTDENIKAGITPKQLADTIKSYRDLTEDEINKALNNIKDLEELSKVAGVKVSIIKDSTKNDKYEIQIQYNGKTYPDIKTPKYINSEQFKEIQKSDILQNNIIDGAIVENIDDLLRGFTSGSINSTQFTNLLHNKFNDGDTTKSNINQDKEKNSGNYYYFTFDYNGKTYSISGVEKAKVNNDTTNDITVASKTDIDNLNKELTSYGIDVSSYFDVVASATDKDGNTTGLYYTLKSGLLTTLGLSDDATIEEIKAAIKTDAISESEKLPKVNSLEDVLKIVQDKDDPNHDKFHVTYDKNSKKYIVSYNNVRATKSFGNSDINDMCYNVYLSEESDNDKEMADLLTKNTSNKDISSSATLYKAMKGIKQGKNISENLNTIRANGLAIKTTGPDNGKYTFTIIDNNENKCVITLDTNANTESGKTVNISYKDKKTIDKYNKEIVLDEAINALSINKGYEEATTQQEIKDIMNDVINNKSVKDAIKAVLKKEYGFDDSEFETFYSDLTKGFADRYAGKYKIENGKCKVGYGDILANLKLDINEKLHEREDKKYTQRANDIKALKNALTKGLRDKTFLEDYPMEAFKEEIGDFIDSLEDKLKSELETLGYDVNDLTQVLESAKKEYLGMYSGTELGESITKTEIIDEFLDILLNKLQSSETTSISSIDFSSVSGYTDNKKVEQNPVPVGKNVDEEVESAIKGLLTKVDSKIKEYIESKYGYTLQDNEFDQIVEDVVKLVAANKNVCTTTTSSYKFNTKDVLDDFEAKLKDYIKDNNPSTKTYDESTLMSKAGITKEELENINMFTKTKDDKYKMNIKYLNERYSEYVKENGSITTPEELKKAIEFYNKQGNEAQCACGTLAEYMDDIIKNVSNYTQNRTEIHTEFGMNDKGNIVFEQPGTTNVYNYMLKKLKANLKEKNPEAYAELGEENLEKLVQAAWITTYNDYPSSTSHNTKDFMTKVFNNLKSIMQKIDEKPEYLDVYTKHTAYANETITNDIIHYGTPSTQGDDEKIDYSGDITLSSDGTVNISNETDNVDYLDTMEELLTRLKETYSTPDADTIERVFKEAQKAAIQCCQGNGEDCPYGTTSSSGIGGGQSVVATANIDWAGTSRSGDEFWITMQELVQMTLYYFDKLLYKELLSSSDSNGSRGSSSNSETANDAGTRRSSRR